MGALIRAKDWSKTPLGPPETWPQSLRTSVSVCLNSRFPILLWWGPDLVKIYNDAYRLILGGKHPRALGARGRDVWPEIWEIIGPMLEGVLSRGQSTWSENQLLLLERQGFPEECYFTFSYSPIHGESGGVQGVFCAVTETTRQVISERRLQTLTDLKAGVATAGQITDVVANTADVLAKNPLDVPFAALYLTDEQGHEARLARVLGFDAAVAPFAPTFRLNQPEPADEWRMRQAVATQAAVCFSMPRSAAEFLTPVLAGQVPHQVCTLPILKPGSSQAVGVLVAGVSPNQTFNADYENFLNLFAGQLAAALENVQALLNERKRTEALQEIDRAKTLFFSNVSHEFRTPLTLMLGPLEEAMKANGQLPAVVHENLEAAHRNALRLQKLVNSLLDFSRIEAGRMRASYAPTDLAALTADLASNFRSVIERAGMRLVVDCPPLPEPAYVDRDMWEKIVLNLLSNAFKYTLDGEIGVSLTAADGQAVLCVRDTGVGIPAAELPRLFERFHRVVGSRGRSFEGTGIGLSLIKELVGLHGGTIAVRSTPGEGSTFTVRIPLGKAHLPAEAVTERTTGGQVGTVDSFLNQAHQLLTAAPPPATARRSAPKAHVVLADDNADMRAYVQRLLEPHYRVSVAADGQEALALVAEHRPDLVLTDVMMPVVDGFALLKTLKADPQTAPIPVVLLSARAGEEATIEGYEAGADDYLVKPFSANELLARVRAQLRMAGERRESEQKLQTVFRDAPVAIAMLNGPDFVFTLANERYCRIARRPVDRLLGKTVMQAFPELEGQNHGFIELLTTIRRTGQPVSIPEQLVKLEDGGRLRDFYFTTLFQPLFDDDRRVTSILVAGHDVTEQVEARRRIEESEQRLALALEAAELGTWDYYPKTDTMYYSGRTVELFGFAPGEPHTLQLGLDAIVEADRQRVAEAVAYALRPESGGHYEAEYALVHGLDGQLRRIQAKGKAFFDDQGVAYRFVGTVLDITERKRLEQKLREQFDELENIYRTAPIGLALMDRDFRFVRINERLAEINGITAQAHVGRSIREIVPDIADQAEAVFNQVFETGEPILHVELEGETAAKPNVKRTWDESWYPIKNEAGETVCLSVVVEEITERKRREANLAFLADISNLFAQFSTPEEIIRTVGEKLGAYLGASACLTADIDETADEVRIDYTWETPEIQNLRGVYRLSEFVTNDLSQAAHAGQPFVVNDTQADSRVSAAGYGAYNIQSFITVPTRRNGEWKFLFTVNCAQKREWRRDEIELIEELTARIFPRLERARAEAALRESEEKFRALADNISQLAWMTDADGWIFWYNQRWYDYTGTTLEEMQGWGWQAVHAPEEVDRVTAKFKRHIAAGETWEDTFPLRSKDGEYRWFLSRAVPIRDAAGKVLRWFGTNTDIEDRRRAEVALRESESRFRQLADFVPPLVWATRPDGYSDFFNQRWFDYTGTTFEQNRGSGWLAVLHPDDVERIRRAWEASVAAGDGYEVEYRIRSREGTYRWFLALGHPIRDEAGAIVRWLGSNTDIHERKTEAERLEALVRERTEALQQANAGLQRSNLNLTQFAYVASHDLQEPLRKIRAFGDMLLRRNGPQLDDAGTDRVRRMQDAAGRMSGLIQDLLDYSRVSTRHETFQPVNLDELLGHVRSDLELVIREKAARLHADPLPTVSGDATQLRQVLQNLLSNALKFSKPDVPPRLEIRHRIVAGAEVRVPGATLAPRARYHEISVSDNGIGFDEQFADRIFEAFQRLHGRAEYSGTGIGLAIVKKVLENHHGGVSVSSRVGEGTTFRVYLPVEK
jgi:PAS domain S-box-containing protein